MKVLSSKTEEEPDKGDVVSNVLRNGAIARVSSMEMPSSNPPVSGLDIPDDFALEEAETPVLYIPEGFSPEEPEPPMFSRLPNGGMVMRELPDVTSLTPAARKVVDDNPFKAAQMLAMADGTAKQADLERAMLKQIRQTQRFYLKPPGMPDDIESQAAQAGMSVNEALFWSQNDKQYLEDEIRARRIVELSGWDGYVASQMATPDGVRSLRYDSVVLAQAEAGYISTYGSEGDRAWYEFRSGIGQVGALAMTGMAFVSRVGSDVTELFTPPHMRNGVSPALLKFEKALPYEVTGGELHRISLPA